MTRDFVCVTLLALAASTGCATIDPVFKAQAESDLECTELEVELERTEHSDVDKTRERRVYLVTGCGQTARYETTVSKAPAAVSTVVSSSER